MNLIYIQTSLLNLLEDVSSFLFLIPFGGKIDDITRKFYQYIKIQFDDFTSTKESNSIIRLKIHSLGVYINGKLFKVLFFTSFLKQIIMKENPTYIITSLMHRRLIEERSTNIILPKFYTCLCLCRAEAPSLNQMWMIF